MAKQLILLRHAKSSWGDNRINDHDRPLNERGQNDAPKMARWMQTQGLVPDHIACSTANRTKSTIGLMLDEWTKPPVVEFVPELYHAPANVYLARAAAFSQQVQCGMLVGHNPGISIFAGQIAEEIDHLPTCACAVFQVSVETWRELESKGTRAIRLLKFQVPKSLD